MYIAPGQGQGQSTPLGQIVSLTHIRFHISPLLLVFSIK